MQQKASIITLSLNSFLIKIRQTYHILAHIYMDFMHFPTILLKFPSYPQRVHQLLHSQCSSQCTRSATVGALTVQQSVHWNSTVSAFGKHNSKEKHAGYIVFQARLSPCLSVSSVPEGKKRILCVCGGKTKKSPSGTLRRGFY